MMDFFRRDIRIDRRFVILFVIVNFLIMGLYYTYSIFVIKQLKENVSSIAVKTSMLNMSSDNLVDGFFNVSSNTSSDITINLSNPSSVSVYYRIMHKGVPTGVSIYEKNGDSSSFGVLESNGSKSVVLTVNNTTSESVSIEFLVEDSTFEVFDKNIGTSYVNVNANFDHSGAFVPSLPSNMIPVYYEPNEDSSLEGTWKKADVSNTNSNYIWYDYDNFMWANAVTVKSDNRDTYLNASAGTVIEKSDINAFFVWIPKFKYFIVSGDGNASYERVINVNFLNRSDISKSGTVNCVESISNHENPHSYSEICTDDTFGIIQNNLSTYMHPAFDENDNGFWIGKFSNSVNSSNIIIKNDQYVYLNNSVVEDSYIRQMIDVDNQYGFLQNSNALYDINTWLYENGNPELDTHMITSMEWGAVSILANSSYGKISNSVYYTDDEKAFTRVFNNTSDSYTGRATFYTNSTTSVETNNNKTVSYYDLTDVTYTKETKVYPIGTLGPGASTTGTIYGVYDMAGGAYTTVMGIVMKEDGTMPNSNYKMDSKYYTAYSYIPYSGKINSNEKAGYLEVFRLGDGIKEHVRTFTKSGMWQDGELTMNNSGIMRRGGFTNSGSMFTTEIVNDNKIYDTFTVLKYNPE